MFFFFFYNTQKRIGFALYQIYQLFTIGLHCGSFKSHFHGFHHQSKVVFLGSPIGLKGSRSPILLLASTEKSMHSLEAKATTLARLFNFRNLWSGGCHFAYGLGGLRLRRLLHFFDFSVFLLALSVASFGVMIRDEWKLISWISNRPCSWNDFFQIFLHTGSCYFLHEKKTIIWWSFLLWKRVLICHLPYLLPKFADIKE